MILEMGKHHSKTKDSDIKVPVKTKEIYLDYVIQDKVFGTGQSGDIIKCINKKNNQTYALKILYYSVGLPFHTDLKNLFKTFIYFNRTE
jgi:hypothetical protein